jgi:hypothetical protein
MKKHLSCFLLSLTICAFVQAQPRLYINVMPGIMNYSGDLQPSALTADQAKAAIQIGVEYRLASKLYLRADYLGGQVHADDKYNDAKFKYRNLNFSTYINEGSLSLEYDIFNLGEKGWTPYVFAGVGVFNFNPYTYDTAGRGYYLQPLGTEGEGLSAYPDRKMYALTQVCIPFGFGLKYALNDNFSIGFEVGFRKLFTDYLDDVSTTYVNPNILLMQRGPKALELAYRGGEIDPAHVYPTGSQRGNPGAKDSYYTGLFRITYGFSQRDNTSSGYRKGVYCPKF